MSRKDKAFELFDKGKRPGDHEVKTIGLKPKTLYNYFQEHKKLRSARVPSDTEIDHLKLHAAMFYITPIMATARQAATEEWGWPANMAIEDFIDTALYGFFEDRGIILREGYYKLLLD